MIGGPWTRSMKGVHGTGPYIDEPGPWTRSTEGVHGPGVHVLYFPAERIQNAYGYENANKTGTERRISNGYRKDTER